MFQLLQYAIRQSVNESRSTNNLPAAAAAAADGNPAPAAAVGNGSAPSAAANKAVTRDREEVDIWEALQVRCYKMCKLRKIPRD